VIPWVFCRPDGVRIHRFYEPWRDACKAAGIQRIPHDFRRTAVRNLERAGVPRTTAMAMIGHKTESIYRRYSIVDQAMLEMGTSKLEALQQMQRSARPKVVALSKGATAMTTSIQGFSLNEPTDLVWRALSAGAAMLNVPAPAGLQ
jgi:integrase-like protein